MTPSPSSEAKCSYKTRECLCSPTFEQVWVLLAVRAEEEEFLGFGLCGQDGDGVAYALDVDCVRRRHLPWQSHLCLRHGEQAGADLVQVKKVAGSLLSSLLQTYHDLDQ